MITGGTFTSEATCIFVVFFSRKCHSSEGLDLVPTKPMVPKTRRHPSFRQRQVGFVALTPVIEKDESPESVEEQENALTLKEFLDTLHCELVKKLFFWLNYVFICVPNICFWVGKLILYFFFTQPEVLFRGFKQPDTFVVFHVVHSEKYTFPGNWRKSLRGKQHLDLGDARRVLSQRTM